MGLGYVHGHGAVNVAMASLLAGGICCMLADLFWLRNGISLICTVRAAIWVQVLSDVWGYGQSKRSTCQLCLRFSSIWLRLQQ